MAFGLQNTRLIIELMMMKNNFLERLGAWSGLIWFMLFGLGWILSEWIPPISPDMTAVEVAEVYKEHHYQLLLGGVLMMLSAFFVGPVTALIVLLMNKIEKRMGALSIVMIVTGATSAVNICLSGVFYAAAAFRPERSPEVVQGLMDFGMLFFFGGISAFIGFFGWTAYASLVLDDRNNPVIPRWFGYLCLWTTIVLIPDVLVFFFKTGPFAWDGIIGFWIPLALFIITFTASPFALKKSVENHL